MGAHSKQPKVVDGIEYWRCSICHIWKPEDDFGRDSRSSNQLKCQCKICLREYKRQVREKYPERNREYRRRAYQKDLKKSRKINQERSRMIKEVLKRRAGNILHLAIRSGKIVIPTNCSKCGKQLKLDAHHEDYNKPLDVQWLCRWCHIKRHEFLRNCKLK